MCLLGCENHYPLSCCILNYSTLFRSMGFRIRDKSLFWTKSGWKNNWEPKILNMPRAYNPSETACVTNRYDHHSYLRMVQSYRNYSRICKQYFYGDKQMQNVLQMELRAAFKIPFRCETPVELIKHGAERRMADQLDRDYELMTYNYHPYQLYAYKLHNDHIRQNNEEADRKEKGETTLSEAIEDAFEAEIEVESKKLGQGEKITVEQIAQVYNRISNNLRAHEGNENQVKGTDGEFTDFLEKRRPFVEADNGRHTH